MAGNYLSVFVLFDAWQEAGRGASYSPLISLTSAELQGEETRETEGEETQRLKGKIEREHRNETEEG